ncbi:unnamed protein product [Rhizophagus irregularis]|nr:unnamed protein product [Rhizophagus irregularis]
MIYVLPEVESITIKNIVYIALSYVITANVEIVRVIERKDKKKGLSSGSSGSVGTEKPLSSTHSQIENDKIAIASIKILSFNEWAKAVVGKRLRRNDDGEEEYEEVNEYDYEDMEEIIDDTPKSSKENNLEKDLSQDRSK